ncbi:hypothetical protein Pla123a_17220 [Posidoniimonas polymericola]|uniref:Ice-binding protein C-terminal domain-containing protein n=1 Tax=Posidoniimonas polymericola TaxID=2528002 RepID=A0A5C5YT59_9BACT|nr:PEP-CTERM sorting domain-containing protein [Posidoniimonas polymericola]TWT77923.1 hypothetical protein Pla123a_17220 [Posidoniimonas polymericola]
MKRFWITASLALIAAHAQAAVDSTTQHGPESTSLDAQIVVGDLIDGLIATELPADTGWHPANTSAADQLPALTDGAGILGSGLTGLLNDFPGAGAPTKSIQYDLAAASDIGSIQVLTGNNGKDGRVFSTFTVSTSTDNGGSFDLLGYFESDPLGTTNAGGIGSTLVTVFDDASSVLAGGVTNLQFDFYAVDNSQGQYRDPFDGVNPFTSVDDGLTAAISSPLLFEVDVLAAVPEPAALSLLAAVAAGGLWRRRR